MEDPEFEVTMRMLPSRGVTSCLVGPGQKIFEAPPTSSKICFLSINPQLNYIINFTNAFDKVKLGLARPARA